MTFSTVLKCGIKRMFWKLRDSPWAMRSRVGTWVMSAPSSEIDPAVNVVDAANQS